MFCFRIIQQLFHTSLNTFLCCFVTILFPPPPPTFPPSSQQSNFTVKLCTLDDHHRNNKISTILVSETERSKVRVSFNAGLSPRAVQVPLPAYNYISQAHVAGQFSKQMINWLVGCVQFGVCLPAHVMFTACLSGRGCLSKSVTATQTGTFSEAMRPPTKQEVTCPARLPFRSGVHCGIVLYSAV